MSPKTIIAIILITLGVVVFTYQGITYTTREKVVDLGPIQMTADKTKTLLLPPIPQSYFARGRHRVAGREDWKGVIRDKMFQP